MLWLPLCAVQLGAVQLGAVQLEIGEDVPPACAASIRAHLAPYLSSAADLRLSLGDTRACAGILPSAPLAPEHFALGREGNLICARGAPIEAAAPYSLGSAYAAYAVLQRLGFAFLHPLDPVAPAELNVSGVAEGERHSEGPALGFRGFHLHTEHPTELSEVLQGADASLAPPPARGGRGGAPSDGPGGAKTVAWESMLPHVSSTFEWLVANRQNRVQWLLLATPAWRRSGWANSTSRMGRLRTLTTLARGFGLFVGADVPIAEVQQRGWFMVGRTSRAEAAHMLAQIDERVRWLLAGTRVALLLLMMVVVVVVVVVVWWWWWRWWWW